MAVPETTVRERVKTVIEAEFDGSPAPDLTVENDKLPRAAGMDGRTRCACFPEWSGEQVGRVVQLVVRVKVQLYLAFTAEPDENIAVDPATIEGYADRLRRAFGPNSSGLTSDMWYLRLTQIDFPDDPTGNKSRLEATIEAACDNPAALG